MYVGRARHGFKAEAVDGAGVQPGRFRASDKHVDSNGSSMPSTGDALLAGAWALVLAGAMLLLLGSLARRENRG